MSEKTVSASPPFPPVFALFFGVLAVSTGAIFARLAGEAPALVIAAYRVGLAALILLPFALYYAGKELIHLEPKEYALAFLSGLFLALHFATWISSLSYTSVANSVVLVNTNPLWVGILTPFIAKEALKKETLISILLSVCGGIIISYGDFATDTRALWGDFLALLGSICAAVYLLIGRRLRAALSLPAYIMLCYGSAAIILWTMVLLSGLPYQGFGIRTLSAFWAMALIPQLMGHSSYNWSLKWFSAGTIAVSLLGEPIVSTVLAWILFNEGLTLCKMLGGALILFAIWFASRSESRG
ncbi:MAG: DMT family transporter [Desulfococcaceae bacterium]|nr:DMT family transporter [Desulfococcaceae bacterium]